MSETVIEPSQAIVMQQKIQHPAQFEITEQTRIVLEAWMH